MSSNMFELPSLEEVKSNVSPAIKYKNLQVNPTVNIDGVAFKSGRVQFIFSVGGNTRWIPSRSYLSMKMALTVSGAGPGFATTQPASGDGVAFAQDPVSTLFNSVNMKIGSTIVSEIQQEVAAINALKVRTSETKDRLDGILADTQNYGSFQQRVQHVSSNVEQKSVTEFTWRPCLGFFDITNAMPAGTYTLELNIDPTWYNKCIQGDSVFARTYNVLPFTTATQFNVAITDTFLNVATLDGPMLGSDEYYLDLSEWNCVSVKLDPTANTRQTSQIEVEASTNAIAVAYIDNNRGTDPVLPVSRFQMGPSVFGNYYDGPATREELLLKRLQVTYAGQSLPDPEAEIAWDPATGVDQTIRRYQDSMVQTGLQDLQQGGPESLLDWQNRGAYYYFTWNKPGLDRSTRVVLNSTFGAGISVVPAALVFSKYRTNVRVLLDSGFVRGVERQFN